MISMKRHAFLGDPLNLTFAHIESIDRVPAHPAIVVSPDRRLGLRDPPPSLPTGSLPHVQSEQAKSPNEGDTNSPSPVPWCRIFSPNVALHPFAKSLFLTGS